MSSIKTYSDFFKKVNEEEEGKMYLNNLQEISTYAAEIREMIDPTADLEAWVQDKITIAHHNMEAIRNYYKSESGEKVEAAPGTSQSTNLGNR
jgi:hypothetical protein